jgi:flagellar biogenesis protein FliO
MQLSVDQIEALAVIGVVCWLVYKFLSPPAGPIPRGPEKMCHLWWKSHH